LRSRLVVEKCVAFLDVSDHTLSGSRFIAFYFHPEARYVVRLLRHKSFELSVGINPWNKPKRKVHIGNLLRRRYGGGGHAYVGGCRFPTKEKALQASREVVQYLQRYP
jgi:hypothetical protein